MRSHCVRMSPGIGRCSKGLPRRMDAARLRKRQEQHSNIFHRNSADRDFVLISPFRDGDIMSRCSIPQIPVAALAESVADRAHNYETNGPKGE